MMHLRIIQHTYWTPLLGVEQNVADIASFPSDNSFYCSLTTNWLD